MNVTFSQRPGKLNFKSLSEIDTTSIINLYYKWEGMQEVLSKLSDIQYGLNGFAPGIVYGKPNSILRECEGSPGVWVFDFTNDVTILMFSDGFRKNCFKGTSYEVVLDNNPKKENVIQALNILFEDFSIKFKKEFPEEQKKLENLVKKFKQKTF